MVNSASEQPKPPPRQLPPRQGDLCPQWPKCRCTARGYINRRETSNCGRKPRAVNGETK